MNAKLISVVFYTNAKYNIIIVYRNFNDLYCPKTTCHLSLIIVLHILFIIKPRFTFTYYSKSCMHSYTSMTLTIHEVVRQLSVMLYRVMKCRKT